MHPAFLYWWKCGRHQADWGTWAGCGPASGAPRWEHHYGASPPHGDYRSSTLGVRRPLRFLAYKLDLDDTQVGELARILAELKTERAQAEVDGQRTLAAFADAVSTETFDQTRAAEAAALRVQSAERLRDAVLRALQRIHHLLDPEQREKLAYLIRTGALAI